MPRRLTRENADAVLADVYVERHLFKIEVGGAVIRVTNSEAVDGPDGHRYESANIDWHGDGGAATVRVSKSAPGFDDIDNLVLARVTITMYFAARGDGDVRFEGDVLAAARDDDDLFLSLRCGHARTRLLPAWSADEESGFNHLPAPGTKLVTPGGDVLVREAG